MKDDPGQLTVLLLELSGLLWDILRLAVVVYCSVWLVKRLWKFRHLP